MCGLCALAGSRFEYPTTGIRNLAGSKRRCASTATTRRTPSPGATGAAPSTRSKFATSSKMIRFLFTSPSRRSVTRSAPNGRFAFQMRQRRLIFCACFLLQNAGRPQGRLVSRHRALKVDAGPSGQRPSQDDPEHDPAQKACAYWHWKDLNVGCDVEIHGRRYRLIDCNASTRVSNDSARSLYSRSRHRD